MTDPTNPQGCHLAISGTNPLTVGGRITVRRDRPLPAVTGERVTGLEIGLQSGSIGVIGGAPVRRMEGIDDTVVQALAAVRRMIVMWTYLFPGELLETYQTCRYWFLRSWTGTSSTT